MGFLQCMENGSTVESFYIFFSNMIIKEKNGSTFKKSRFGSTFFSVQLSNVKDMGKLCSRLSIVYKFFL